ncbi:MAG TPA: hypothetical protein VH478_10155 [Trebonia sp.]|jgi:hypothetical protein|nr:hypothetical protein [Trebonia sp.]
MHAPDDELGDALHRTSMIRLALDAMWLTVDELPDDADAPDPVRHGLSAIGEWLHQQEAEALRRSGLIRQYLVIHPVSLSSPPPAEAMAEITAAVRTLERHGLIITD